MSKQDTFVEFMSYWRQIFVHCKLSEHFAIHFQSEVNISLDHLSHKRWQMILLLANLMIKEMSIHNSEMPIPSCLRTAVWIFRSSIFSVLMLVLLSITLLLKTTSVALTIFSIAGDGSTNPPCCFQHVNFAYTGYDSTVNAVGSIGSRNNSFLHFLQLIFCMRFRIINPAM